MNLNVTNKNVYVGIVDVLAVASSSVFLIGDTETIICSSAFDTPPESLIIGPNRPLPGESEQLGGG